MTVFTKRNEAHEFYADFLADAQKRNETKQAMAELGRRDLFFLLVRLLNRQDVDRDWLFDRCQEVQESPNGMLDLWSREHYKSTIITFALTIQDILNDPEITIGLFSVTRPLAKKFLSQIREELTANRLLYELYPDILWESPSREAPKWSLDDGIVVKRQSNSKEQTVEAYGLVEGLPTGPHFNIRIYDDIIDERNVTNPDMIKKALTMWEQSLNLGSAQPCEHYGVPNIERYAGTRYGANDPYATILKREVATPRIYPGTHNGKVDGDPVLWTKELMATKRRSMGPYIFGCQILQNPTADEAQGFRPEWLQYWRREDGWDKFNLYMLCDPANAKKKTNDYTVILIIGYGPDKNYYLVYGMRDRLNLEERTRKIMELHRAYRPIGVGYERYGKDSDIQHIEYVQKKEQYRFQITELGGQMPKNDRIRRLIPIFSGRRFFLPGEFCFHTAEKKTVDFTAEFINEEYLSFPVSQHDDMMDCMARILEPDMMVSEPMPAYPFGNTPKNVKNDYDPLRHRRKG